MLDVIFGFCGCGECTKESVSIQYQSSLFGIRPIMSCNVNIKLKSSLNQTKVKGVLVVGSQKPSAKYHDGFSISVR